MVKPAEAIKKAANAVPLMEAALSISDGTLKVMVMRPKKMKSIARLNISGGYKRIRT